VSTLGYYLDGGLGVQGKVLGGYFSAAGLLGGKVHDGAVTANYGRIAGLLRVSARRVFNLMFGIGYSFSELSEAVSTDPYFHDAGLAVPLKMSFDLPLKRFWAVGARRQLRLQFHDHRAGRLRLFRSYRRTSVECRTLVGESSMFVLLVVSLFSAEPSLAPTVAGVPLRGPAETGRAAGFTAPVMGEGLTACPDTAPYECPGGCCTADYPYCCDDYCGSTPDACGGGGDSGGGGGGGGCPGDYPYDCGDYCCAANFPYCCGDSTCGSTAECGGGGGGGSGGSGSGGGGGGGETCPADYPYLCDTYCCAAEYPYCCGDQICGATSACGGGGGGGGGGGCVDPLPRGLRGRELLPDGSASVLRQWRLLPLRHGVPGRRPVRGVERSERWFVPGRGAAGLW
jgi:hypothetical protein